MRRIEAANIDESFKLGAITACLCVIWNDLVGRKNCIAGEGRDNYGTVSSSREELDFFLKKEDF